MRGGYHTDEALSARGLTKYIPGRGWFDPFPHFCDHSSDGFV